MNHLPKHLTTFIGRKKELQDIQELFDRPACRLITLVGPGGIGKSRLAIQVAARLDHKFPHGIFFVGLGTVASTEFIISAIAETMGYPLRSQVDPGQQLFNYLANKTMLLVLDNFDLLAESRGMLVDLLNYTTEVKLLVTSREALNVQEEWRYQLQGLPFPAKNDDGSDKIYKSIQLFTERAQQVRQDFSLEKQRAGVIRICQVVEGLPLALEIAATWTKILDCNAIADEIERNLNFLTSSLFNISEQHHSMRAVFDQTWRRLRKEEQEIFKRLSIFRGSFSTEAATFVAGALFTDLVDLVDKSLLQTTFNQRYQMHGLLRQYADGHLRAESETEGQAQEAHCSYYARLLEGWRKRVVGADEVLFLSDLAVDLDNIWAAWKYAIQHLYLNEIQKSAYVLFSFLDFKSRFLEGIECLEDAIRYLEMANQNFQILCIKAELFVYQSWFYCRLGQLNKAVDVLQKSEAIYTQLQIPPPAGLDTDPLVKLCMVYRLKGDYMTARLCGEQAWVRSEVNNDQENLFEAKNMLAHVAFALGEYDDAQRRADMVYTSAQEMNSPYLTSSSLNLLGNIARAQGRYSEARRYYGSAYEIRREYGDQEDTAVVLGNMGRIALLQHNFDAAKKTYDQSLAIQRELQNQWGTAVALQGLGDLDVALGNFSEARKFLAEALQIFADLGTLPQYLSTLVVASELLFKIKDYNRSSRLLTLILDHPACDHESRVRGQRLLDRLHSKISYDNLSTIAQNTKNDLTLIGCSLQQEWSEHGDQIQPRAFPSVQSQQEMWNVLTSRESEVARLIAEGKSNREIAKTLVVEVKTVESHITHILNRLGFSSRVQIATLVVAQDSITPPYVYES